MNYEDFFRVMEFPKEWIEWDMLPPELRRLQLDRYKVGDEESSEHDRNGAFHWWLRKQPPMTPAECEKLYKLTYLDPDQLMAENVREYIEKLPDFSGFIV